MTLTLPKVMAMAMATAMEQRLNKNHFGKEYLVLNKKMSLKSSFFYFLKNSFLFRTLSNASTFLSLISLLNALICF